jgi:hypothetical protein
MRAVVRLLANPVEAAAMGKAGRAKAETMRWEAVNAIAMEDFVGLVSGEIPLRQRRRIWQVV